MNPPSYFVLVFGDPKQHGDEVEKGRYEAEKGYPAFEVVPGDMLLLYCTEGYEGFKRQFPGIGVALKTQPDLVEYRWIPFSRPVQREMIDEAFDVDDRVKMDQLRFNNRRAFEISRSSFSKIAVDRPLGSGI